MPGVSPFSHYRCQQWLEANAKNKPAWAAQGISYRHTSLQTLPDKSWALLKTKTFDPGILEDFYFAIWLYCLRLQSTGVLLPWLELGCIEVKKIGLPLWRFSSLSGLDIGSPSLRRRTCTSAWCPWLFKSLDAERGPASEADCITATYMFSIEKIHENTFCKPFVGLKSFGIYLALTTTYWNSELWHFELSSGCSTEFCSSTISMTAAPWPNLPESPELLSHILD